MYEKCILLVSLCLVLATAVTAEIRNGYAPDMPATRECIRELKRRLTENGDMPNRERRRINAAIKKHLQLMADFQLTEALLQQMKMISPGMYNEMDHLIDKRGRVTDIYIRFILPEESSMLLNGASFFQASDMDEDASQSRFGQFTVSIDVLICETALNLLAHEFGHVKYIVPNLATYRQYYRHTYNLSTMAHRLGHSGSDASGRMSSVFGSQFLRDRRTFRITFGEPPRHVATLIREVNRNAREEVVGMFDDPIASSDSFE